MLWYEAGRHRSRRFPDEPAARRFDAERLRAADTARDAATARVAEDLAQLRARVEQVERQLPVDARTSGVYSYATRAGVRWRIAVRTPDGTVTTRRGYESREAACRARDRLTARDDQRINVSFARHWHRWLADKEPYLTVGALEDLEAHGRKRLLPHLGQLQVTDIHERTSATG